MTPETLSRIAAWGEAISKLTEEQKQEEALFWIQAVLEIVKQDADD